MDIPVAKGDTQLMVVQIRGQSVTDGVVQAQSTQIMSLVTKQIIRLWPRIKTLANTKSQTNNLPASGPQASKGRYTRNLHLGKEVEKNAVRGRMTSSKSSYSCSCESRSIGRRVFVVVLEVS
jgi:hypothetical protein